MAFARESQSVVALERTIIHVRPHTGLSAATGSEGQIS
jgi:hypothetical protein